MSHYLPTERERLTDQLQAQRSTLQERLRAAGPTRSCDHLFDPDLLRRLTASEVVIGDDGEGEPVRRKRQRKPSLTAAIRQIKRAGVEISGCTINRDGSVNVITGRPSITNDDTAPVDRSEWN